MKVLVNEIRRFVEPGTTLEDLRRRFKPSADILIKNGFPAEAGVELHEGDRVTLIVKGEKPSSAELEVLMAARHTPGVHERMKAASIAVAGLGGLGSTAAIALARIGVGRLILVDFDRVEPSNLNRQAYRIEHIGLPKCEAMTDLLSKINPAVRVEAHRLECTPENSPRLFAEADIILECFDMAEAKVMLLETVARELPGTYLISSSGVAGYGGGNAIQARRLGERVFIVGDMVSEAGPGMGLMAPRVGIAAHLQADLAVALLMDPEKAAAELPEVDDPELD